MHIYNLLLQHLAMNNTVCSVHYRLGAPSDSIIWTHLKSLAKLPICIKTWIQNTAFSQKNGIQFENPTTKFSILCVWGSHGTPRRMVGTASIIRSYFCILLNRKSHSQLSYMQAATKQHSLIHTRHYGTVTTSNTTAFSCPFADRAPTITITWRVFRCL